MVVLNIFCIYVDSILPPFNQTLFPPSTSCTACCAATGEGRSAVPGQWGNFVVAVFLKGYCDGLLRRNISDIFHCRTKSTNVRKRIFFLFNIAVVYHCFSLGKNFKRPTIPWFVMKCCSSCYSILNPFAPRRTVPTSTAVSL
jgi:hypothetical protein